MSDAPVSQPFEINFFDADPDGEVDRAGDGFYFQIDGEKQWSGPYSSTTEATELAQDAIVDAADCAGRAVSAFTAALAKAEAALGSPSVLASAGSHLRAAKRADKKAGALAGLLDEWNASEATTAPAGP